MVMNLGYAALFSVVNCFGSVEMGQLMYTLVVTSLRILFTSLLSFPIAFLLVWGLGRKRSPLIRTFGTVLLASIAYEVTTLVNLVFLFSWFMQFNLWLAPLMALFSPVVVFFFVFFIGAMVLLDLSPGRIGIAAVILCILSYFIWWAASYLIFPLVPFLQVIQSWPTP
ncbi:MAG: hypothetical protein ACFFCF_10210 [Promethearchaeota archaeon]